MKALSGPQVFELLANQHVDFDERYACEWDARECLRLADGSLLARHRDGSCHYFEQPPALEAEHIEGDERVGSRLTELKFPSQFPGGVEATVEQLFAELAIPAECTAPALAARLKRLTRLRYQRALILTYGELLRRHLGGAWLGVAHPDGMEPALVSASHGLTCFMGYLLQLSTKARLPEFEMILGFSGPPPLQSAP